VEWDEDEGKGAEQGGTEQADEAAEPMEVNAGRANLAWAKLFWIFYSKDPFFGSGLTPYNLSPTPRDRCSNETF
jgi:hypothetical protein